MQSDRTLLDGVRKFAGLAKQCRCVHAISRTRQKYTAAEDAPRFRVAEGVEVE